VTTWSKLSIDQQRSLLAIPFGLTRSVRGTQSAFRRLRAGEIDGRRAWRFDLVINRRTVGSSNDTTADNYSAAIVSLHSRIDGRIGLERRAFLRESQPLGAPEVDVGTETFGREYRVRSSPPELAIQLLDNGVCDWLCRAGTGFHYEIVHDRVLAYGWRRYVSTKGPLRAAAALAQLLDGPRAVQERCRSDLNRQLDAIGLR
jgi:hypothetical protein